MTTKKLSERRDEAAVKDCPVDQTFWKQGANWLASELLKDERLSLVREALKKSRNIIALANLDKLIDELKEMK